LGREDERHAISTTDRRTNGRTDGRDDVEVIRTGTDHGRADTDGQLAVSRTEHNDHAAVYVQRFNGARAQLT